MQVGQKVVCINDKFPLYVQQSYRDLPKQDKVYTIREVSVGCGHAKSDSPNAQVPEGELLLLLAELNNAGVSLTNKHGLEPGFNAERFELLFDDEQEVEMVEAIEDFIVAHK